MRRDRAAGAMSGKADAALSAPGVAVTAERLRALRAAARERGAPPAPSAAHGSVTARRRGMGMEPRDLRPFTDGDDPRALDARASARAGRAMVRDFHDERAQALLLVADFRPPMLWGTRGRLRSVAAAEALALAGWRAAEAGARVGCVALVSGEPVVARMRPGARGMEAAIGAMVSAHARALALGALATSPPLDLCLTELRAQIGRGAEALIASSFEDEGAEAALAALARRALVRLIAVRDAFETAPPPGVYPVARPTGGAVWARFGPSRRAVSAAEERLRRFAALGLPTAALDGAAGLAEVRAALATLDAHPAARRPLRAVAR